MTAVELRDLKEVLREVVREELSALVAGEAPKLEPVLPAAVVSAAELPAVESGADWGPYLLSDREMYQAEELLDEGYAKVLRLRVFAARASQVGIKETAVKFRNQADRLERRLEGNKR